MVPYLHECSTREDIKAARAQMFALLKRPYPPPARELNCESMTFEEWINAANFGAGQQEDSTSSGHVHGMVAVLAWARGEDPTEWAAAKYTMPVRPGEHLQRGTHRVPVIGIDGKGNPIIGAAWDHKERRRQLVDLHLPLPSKCRHEIDFNTVVVPDEDKGWVNFKCARCGAAGCTDASLFAWNEFHEVWAD